MRFGPVLLGEASTTGLDQRVLSRSQRANGLRDVRQRPSKRGQPVVVNGDYTHGGVALLFGKSLVRGDQHREALLIGLGKQLLIA